ncbi:MAG: phage tail tape measure protein [Chloroflexi bacterium]|nr:phage tail tape measure protein [Chloroflexota bacterium]
MNLGQLVVDLLLRDQQFAPSLKQAEAALQKFGGAATAIASKVDQAFLAVGAAAAGIAASSAIVGSAFDAQITRVATLAGATGAELEALTAAARRMGADSKFSASQAAQAMEALAAAGFSVAETIAGTEAALALAAASGGDLATATSLVASTLNQFGLDASESARLADVFAVATNSSALNLEGLAEAMSYAGTVGATFGYSVEETAAAVAMFSNLGLDASRAGTALRMSLSAAANVSGPAADALARYGLTAKDISPELKSFGEILKTVGTAGITTADALKIFGQEAGGALATLAQQSVAANQDVTKSFDGLVYAAQNSIGEATQLQAAGSRTVAATFEEARGAFEDVLIALYDTYAKPLQRLLAQLGDNFRAITGAISGSSDALSGGFGAALDGLTAWLDANEQRLASLFVAAAEAISLVGQAFIAVLPYIEEIGAALLAIWAVTKVYAFIQAVEAAVTVIASVSAAAFGAEGAIAALSVTLGISTGGIYLLVVAVGALVTALGALALGYRDATSEAERLQAAQDRAKASAASFDEVQARAADKLLAATRDRSEALINEKGISERVRQARQMEALELAGMTAAEAARAENLGQLIRVQGVYRKTSVLAAESTKDGQAAIQTAIIQTSNNAEQFREEIAALNRDIQAGAPNQAAMRVQLDYLSGALRETEQRSENLTRALNQGRVAAAIGARGSRGRATAAELEAQAVEAAAEAERKAAEERKRREREERAALEAIPEVRDEAADAFLRELYAAQRAQAGRVAAEQAYAEAVRTYEAEAQAIRRDAMSESQRLAEERADAINAIEADLANKLIAIEHLTEADRAALATQFTERTEAARASIVADYEKRITAAREDEIKAAMKQPPIWAQSWREATKGATEAIPAAFRVAFARTSRDVQAFVRSTIRAFDDIGDAVGNVLGAVDGLFAKVLGVSLGGALSDFISAAQEAATAGDNTQAANFAKSFVKNLVTQATQVGQFLATAIGPFIEALVDAIPVVVAAFVDALPAIIDALVAGIPRVLQAVADALPQILQTLVQGAADLVDAVVRALPAVVQAIATALPGLVTILLEELPRIIQSIGAAIPQILTALVQAIPQVLNALVAGLPAVLNALFEAVPQIITAVVLAVPQIIVAVLEAVPQIFGALVQSLPTLITAVLAAIPDIILGLIDALPDVIGALVGLLPMLVAQIIGALPEIITALVEGIVVNVIARLPEIILALIKGLGEAIVNIGKALGEAILAAIKGLFGLGGGKKKRDQTEGSFYSGIEYVPATMRATLHQGEAVIPADRNAERMRGAAPAAAGARQVHGGGGGAGAAPVEISVVAEGRLLEAVQVRAQALGRATSVVRSVRRAAGVQVGLDRGKFNPWSL